MNGIRSRYENMSEEDKDKFFDLLHQLLKWRGRMSTGSMLIGDHADMLADFYREKTNYEIEEYT